jgi:glycosyltransferase involved in cell wall biosynthesis
MNKPKKIIIIGSAHPLRGGGIASFNERLAREFSKEGFDISIYTFSLQYPAFLFPGSSQYSTEPAPADLQIQVCINSINPFNWIHIGNKLNKLMPDIIVVRFWIPFMGPSLGTILRRVKKNKYTKVICIADNIIPHEKKPGDMAFTKYFLKPVDAFITMSEKVLMDLRKFVTKPAQFVPHPLYDNFGDKVSKEEARNKLGIGLDEKIILFFGFIRKYKGLDILLKAMKILKDKKSNIKLLIAGEFYDDKTKYMDLIEGLGIRDDLILHTGFIRDMDVRYHLCAADCVVQPYRNATQSGVTPLAYHFEKPMIVTNVGGLPSVVPDKAGLIAEPDPHDIAEKILSYFQLGENYFLPQLREEKKKYSWRNMVQAIIAMAEAI